MDANIENIYTWWVDGLLWFARYFLFAGLGYFIFSIWFRRRFAPLKIREKKSPKLHIRREILHSIRTLLIYTATSWVIFSCYYKDLTSIYTDINRYGALYFAFSIVILIFLHDAYFYWTHRLLHLPGIFGVAHKTHHLSKNPTPWSSFSFDTIEAFVSVGYIPAIVFLIPIHPIALFAFLTYMVFVNVLGHLGFEVFPLRLRKSKMMGWHNTATNHTLHHHSPKHNFGLYFTFWDRLMGTYKDEV